MSWPGESSDRSARLKLFILYDIAHPGIIDYQAGGGTGSR